MTTNICGQQHTQTISPESFAKAYRKGFRLTVRFLLSKGATVDVAEELAQTAWVRGWEARDQLRVEDRIVPWVNSIAYHGLCRDQRRAARFIELTEVPAGKAPASNQHLDVAILLKLCSPFDRILLEQRYVDGMDMKEIAATQGLSVIAVRVRIHRCKNGIRSFIERSERNTKKALHKLLARCDREEQPEPQAA